MLVFYCNCTHTKVSHNMEGCKRYDCSCTEYVETSVVDKNVDRKSNYGANVYSVKR